AIPRLADAMGRLEMANPLLEMANPLLADAFPRLADAIPLVESTPIDPALGSGRGVTEPRDGQRAKADDGRARLRPALPDDPQRPAEDAERAAEALQGSAGSNGGRTPDGGGAAAPGLERTGLARASGPDRRLRARAPQVGGRPVR